MKKVTSLINFLLIVSSITVLSNKAFTQEEQENFEGAKFEYKAENNRIDLGIIHLDAIEEVNLEVEFENTGNEPLVLSSVRACCGTSVNDYPEEPIYPGDVGVIELYFRVAPRPHNISRSVIVTSNDPAGRKILRITGKVEEKEE